MAVRKRCRSSGCKTSPRCDHAWWLDVMHHGKRHRMPVDDFAFPRGAKAPITSKQEAEKVWEPKFIAEIASGEDPRKGRSVKALPASRQQLPICSRCIDNGTSTLSG